MRWLLYLFLAFFAGVARRVEPADISRRLLVMFPRSLRMRWSNFHSKCIELLSGGGIEFFLDRPKRVRVFWDGTAVEMFGDVRNSGNSDRITADEDSSL